MTRITITATGQILRDGRFAPASIVGTSPRELLADGIRVDVTHVWGSTDLEAAVAALLDGASLPAGLHMRTRRDGVQMVGRDR